MKKQPFLRALFLAMLVLAFCCMLSACAGEEPVRQSVVFPAYEEENPADLPFIDRVNSTPEFQVTLELPKGWTIEEQRHGGEIDVPGSFYSALLLCKGGEPAAYIGFNLFDPESAAGVPPQDYYKAVYPELRLSSAFFWNPYTPVAETENGEAGVAEIWYKAPEELNSGTNRAALPERETVGVLCYDRELGVYVGIAFAPGTMELEEAAKIAKTLFIQPI